MKISEIKISKDFIALLAGIPDSVNESINKCIDKVNELPEGVQLMFLTGLCLKSGVVAALNLECNNIDFLKDLCLAIVKQYSIKKNEDEVECENTKH